MSEMEKVIPLKHIFSAVSFGQYEISLGRMDDVPDLFVFNTVVGEF